MPYTLHGPLPVMDESMVHAAIDHCVVGGEGAWLRPLTNSLATWRDRGISDPTKLYHAHRLLDRVSCSFRATPSGV